MKMPLGSVYEQFKTPFLVDIFSQGPARLRVAVNGLKFDDVTQRPRHGKWSILEVVLHLADSELVGAVRFRLATVETEVTLPVYDQDRWANDFHYEQCAWDDFIVALDLFDKLRQSSLRVLTNLKTVDWQRAARHPERGPMTIRQLLELYADHSERHIEQIVEMRKLIGKPMDIPSLLPDRLY